MQIRPVGTESFHADGRMDRQTTSHTDIMKLIVTFFLIFQID